MSTAYFVVTLVAIAAVGFSGVAAAVGLVLFFVCAVYTHLLARDYSGQFGLATGFLALSAATLALGLASA